MSVASKIVLNLAKLAGLGLVAVAFGEAFIRIASPEPLIPRYVTGTDNGVRGNIPNARYWHVTPDVKVELRINAQGMRSDREYPKEKPPGTCRIAMFGDSFFMGYELSLENTFPVLVEKKLHDKGFNVEALNFSVSGFGTAESIRTYETVGRTFSPDFTFFEIHETDPIDNIRSDLFDFKDGTLTETGRNYLPAVKAQDTLMRLPLYNLISDNSHLYSFLREWATIEIKQALVAYNSIGEAKAAPAAPVEDELAQGSNAVELTGALLLYAKKISEADNAEFYGIDIPSGFGLDVSKPGTKFVPQRLLPELNVITPFPEFRAATAKGSIIYYTRGHAHLTPAGTEILSDKIVERLLQSAKLTTCKTE